MSLFLKITDMLGLGRKRDMPALLPKSDAHFEAPVPKQDQVHACSAYTSLKARYRDIGRMNAIVEVLGRDFLTAMPEGAYKSRLGQIAFLYRRMHEDLIADDIHALLGAAQDHQYAHPDDWDEWDSANLREMRSLYLMSCHVDADLMEDKARLSYEGRRRHRDIMKTGDWEQAKGFLQEQIDLHRRIADSRCRASGTGSHYEMLMQEYMPGMTLPEVENLLDTHAQALRRLWPEIVAKQANDPPAIPFDGSIRFDAEAQMWLNRSLLGVLGFDFERGGLYETGHNPVEGGTVDDTRLVIFNVDAHNFLDSMKSALHEGGHGLYIQGLPRETWRYQPVAMDMGAGVHESQALLVEMIIGRKLEFFQFLSPRLEGLFHGIHSPALSPDNLFRLKTRVKAGLDRKKADEASYFYHVLLRFRLERDLIDGTLDVDKLPEKWAEGMQELLGVTPASHREGCLQDVHWFVGKFGYFPSYAVGHMMAAQLYEALRRDIPDIHTHIAGGQFTEIQNWLHRHIYAKGRLLPIQELVKQATGKPLRPEYLEKHLRRRYLH